jgi:hypothetical protein
LWVARLPGRDEQSAQQEESRAKHLHGYLESETCQK